MGPTIFIIEDDPKIARVVKAYIEGAGYTARNFSKGLLALEEARHNAPALVILDLMLPDVSGEELFQDLKSLGDIPVIMGLTLLSGTATLAGKYTENNNFPIVAALSCCGTSRAINITFLPIFLLSI